MENNDRYIYFDNHVPYKNLKLYPIKMEHYFEFQTLASILVIDKNSVWDAIPMTYLEYILKEEKRDEKGGYLYRLGRILIMALSENYRGDPELKLPFDYSEGFDLKFLFDGSKNCYFSVDGEMFDSKDFDEIKGIIVAQNLLTPPNENIEKSLRDAMEDDKRIRQKISGNKAATIEDQMIGLSVKSGISLEDIYGMTIRKFIKSLERLDHALHYEILLAAQASGFVKYKTKPKHWLANLEKDELDGTIPYSEMEQRLSPATGGK